MLISSASPDPDTEEASSFIGLFVKIYHQNVLLKSHSMIIEHQIFFISIILEKMYNDFHMVSLLTMLLVRMR
jgi:hypothetical protein